MHTSTSFSTPTSRYQALQTRNQTAHSAFVYAVLTTRIVCRPTCPSRLARRSNIVYYDTVLEALLAGFRPCKRCKPDLPDELDSDTSAELVIRACRVIESRGGRITVGEVAESMGVSGRHLFGLFRGRLGVSLAGYAACVRRGLVVKEGKGSLGDDWDGKVDGMSDSSGDSWVPFGGDNGVEMRDMLDGKGTAFDDSETCGLNSAIGRSVPQSIYSGNDIIAAG